MKHLLVYTLLLIPYFAIASIGDSVTYLTQTDTVMLEIADDQSKFTTHTFEAKQTLYSLSRFYAQDIDRIYALNTQLTERAPKIGEVVRVAVPNITIKRHRDETFDRSQYAPVCYTVKKGETMFHVAKRIFRMPVDSLQKLNHLQSTELSLGQIVQVGWMPVKGSADKIVKQELSPLQRTSFLNYKSYSQQEKKVRSKTGVASFSAGTGEASASLFALYAKAKPGHVLKITNNANKKIAYVKVIGKPSLNSRAEQVDIQVSGTVARLLGTSKGNFYVTIE